MIARDDHLRPMGKAVHPVSGVLEFPKVLAAPAQVTRMHEDISVGNGELAMKGVRIGNRHNPHNPSVLSPPLPHP